MQNAIQALCTQPFIGNDTDDRRHQDRGECKCRKDGAKLWKAPTLSFGAVGANCGEPSSPNKKLKKTEEGKSSFDGGG